MKLQYSNIERFKYRLTRVFKYQLPGVFPEMVYPEFAPHAWLHYGKGGVISFYSGYCWDGSSGPTIDSKKCQRAGLVHDGAYQLLREGVFGGHEQKEDAREYFDNLYYNMCVEDGMGKRRAWVRWKGLRWFGKKAASVN
jgi:hypothetical protein